MSIDLNQTISDPNQPEFQAMLEKLQCNILKAHGRDHTAHLFLRFTGAAQAVRAWIHAFAANPQYVTSAWRQLEQTLAYRVDHTPGGLVGSFYLAADGYRYLGFDVDRFSDDSKTYRNGMKSHHFDLLGQFILDTSNKDPLPTDWEDGYQQSIHALILLADDDEAVVRAEVANVAASLEAVAAVLVVEFGGVLRNNATEATGKNEALVVGARGLDAPPPSKGQPIEHFGYVDGRSNPLFFDDDIARETNGGGTDHWDPSAPLSLVLVSDPFATDDMSFGSYFVFRKLEQKVKDFNADVIALAAELGIEPALAGAFAFGRFKDGTPVTLQAEPGLGDSNNFAYAPVDEHGNRCPFHAHTRKVNPRGGTPFTSLEDERKRRIVRRGIPYGTVGDAQVGLLFMCYQHDINLQFEFIQRTWADNPNFPRWLVLPGTGDDPIIGQDTDGNAKQHWPTGWDAPSRVARSFEGYVTLRGGEYFFAPSISFLQNI